MHVRCLSSTSVPKVAPLIITMHGPVPYLSDKTVPCNYGGDVHYHGIEQDWPVAEDSSYEKDNSDISNIAGTIKITRSRRIFSPEIAPLKAVSGPVIIPVVVSPLVPQLSPPMLQLTKLSQSLLSLLLTFLLPSQSRLEVKVF